MRCFLHIGTEKTGSSFLQCKLALARDQLLQQGIWFAYGAPFDEECMRSGRISGGNALKAAEDMERDDWPAIQKHISSWKAETTERAVNDVLISSELLLRPLSLGANLSRLVTELLAAGFEKVELLLILRNPVDQLVSLYKHRAKRGTTGEIQKWCETGYSLPHELAGLRSQLPESEGTLTVRQYDRHHGALDRIFFEDWLVVPVPSIKMPSTVNPSLTLPELAMIHRLASTRADLVAPLYEHLIGVPPGQKVKSKALEDHARGVAEATVWQYREEWRCWNEMLPAGECLTTPDQAPDILPCPEELGFSGKQLDGLAAFLAEAVSFSFLAKLIWRSRIRPGLGRIARAVRVRK